MTLSLAPLPVAVLIATCNRIDLLMQRSLPSVLRQTLTPEEIIIVNDGGPWSDEEYRGIVAQAGTRRVTLLHNCRTKGAGGAWNTGLAYLLSQRRNFMVAILDDDDEWDVFHLEDNQRTALNRSANIVVSGLKIAAVAGEVVRPLIDQLCARDFLVGNPGWQGSNTFVDLGLLAAVGGFRESLRSLHDRDLAIRLLRHADARTALVPRWTATWHIGHPGRLSDYRGQAKLEGLRVFWALYAQEMSSHEQAAFLARAQRLFGFSAGEITLEGMSELPSIAPVGDLHALCA